MIIDSMYLGYDAMKIALFICGLPFQNTIPLHTMRKNIGQIPIEGQSTKYLTRLKTVTV
jgi:hypothetical protein